MTSGVPVPNRTLEREWEQRLAIIPVARLLKRAYRARVFGDDAIPHDRPVVYVGKHPRTWLYLETIVLGLVAYWDAGRPPFHVLEQRDTSLHRVPVLGWIRRHGNTIPATMDAALEVLARGESVLTFPGGTRELYGQADTLRWSGRTGFARIALVAGAPIVPFAIIGADRQHRGRVRVGRSSIWLPPVPLPVRLDYWFGEPILSRGSANSRTDIDALAARAYNATRRLIATGLARRSASRSLQW